MCPQPSGPVPKWVPLSLQSQVASGLLAFALESRQGKLIAWIQETVFHLLENVSQVRENASGGDLLDTNRGCGLNERLLDSKRKSFAIGAVSEAWFLVWRLRMVGPTGRWSWSLKLPRSESGVTQKAGRMWGRQGILCKLRY